VPSRGSARSVPAAWAQRRRDARCAPPLLISQL